MLQKTVLFIFLFLLVLLQVSFFPTVFPSGSSPDMILLFIVFLVAKKGFDFSAPKVISAGLLYELMSFQPIGVKIFSLALVAFITGYLSIRFLVSQRNWRAPILLSLIILGTVLDHVFLESLLSLIEYFRGSMVINFHSIFNLLIWKKIVLNILFAPVIYYLMKKIDQHFGLYSVSKLG